MSPSGDTNEAVQPPSDTIAPIGCPERSANAFASPLNPKPLSLAAISGICCGIHMPSSANRPAANSETPSTTTDALAIFNGVVLQQSKRQMMSFDAAANGCHRPEHNTLHTTTVTPRRGRSGPGHLSPRIIPHAETVVL